MPPEPVQQQDHQDYRDEINAALSQTSSAQSVLMGTLQMRNAVPPSSFMPFYQSFNHLFNLTSRLKVMQEHESDLITRIDKWLEHTNKIDVSRVLEGSKLFREWSWKLEYHGIHTFSK